MPDWLAGVGTVGSVLVIGLGLIREMRASREAKQRLEDERRDDQATQARLVVARIGISQAIVDDPATGNPRGAAGKVAWVVENYSGAPVFNLHLAIHDRVTGSTVAEPTPIRVLGESQRNWTTLNPPLISDEATFDLSRLAVQIKFTDAKGRVWTRTDQELPQRQIDPVSVSPQPQPPGDRIA